MREKTAAFELKSTGDGVVVRLRERCVKGIRVLAHGSGPLSSSLSHDSAA